jgi:hypothetical protein
VPAFVFEKAIDERVPERWWERVAHEWEDVIGTRRLDLMVAELRELIPLLESAAGRAYDEAELNRILELANEQQEWSRRTRDLLAQTSPAPIDIVDSIPAVMIPQWHRGTEWARDAARGFHEEVETAIARGDAVCPDERLRLMWIGRGLWFNLGFYQHFQERYGAVFVWSMYLAIAADGYPRYGGEPPACGALRGLHRLPRAAGLGRPVVRRAGADASRRRRRPPRRPRLARQLLHDDRARGGGDPRARHRR